VLARDLPYPMACSRVRLAKVDKFACGGPCGKIHLDVKSAIVRLADGRIRAARHNSAGSRRIEVNQLQRIELPALACIS
jgi:hypothetical protein